MKKVFASALALTMAVAMSAPVIAAEIGDGKGKGEGSYEIGVSGTYQSGTGGATVISVDVAWDEMSFEYHAGNAGTWQPDKHTYEGTQAGGWSATKKSITVKNHSNKGITATFSFDKDAELTKEVTGSFYETSTAATALTEGNRKLDLATAEGTTRNDGNQTEDQTPKGTIYFGISGEAIDSSAKLGTITVTIAQK